MQLLEVFCLCPEAGYCQGIKADDILILPMDMVKFNAHQECLDRVLSHFGKASFHYTVPRFECILIRGYALSWT